MRSGGSPVVLVNGGVRVFLRTGGGEDLLVNESGAVVLTNVRRRLRACLVVSRVLAAFSAAPMRSSSCRYYAHIYPDMKSSCTDSDYVYAVMKSTCADSDDVYAVIISTCADITSLTFIQRLNGLQMMRQIARNKRTHICIDTWLRLLVPQLLLPRLQLATGGPLERDLVWPQRNIALFRRSHHGPYEHLPAASLVARQLCFRQMRCSTQLLQTLLARYW